nr:MAG TPA: hypothetical protein [Caudoviricetes sp.]
MFRHCPFPFLKVSADFFDPDRPAIIRHKAVTPCMTVIPDRFGF